MIIFFTDHAVTIKFNVPWRFMYKELRAYQKMRKKKKPPRLKTARPDPGVGDPYSATPSTRHGDGIGGMGGGVKAPMPEAVLNQRFIHCGVDGIASRLS